MYSSQCMPSVLCRALRMPGQNQERCQAFRTCLNQCKFYDVKSIKTKVRTSLRNLYNSIRKYSKLELKCSNNQSKAAIKRLIDAQKLLESGNNGIAVFTTDKVKICDTVYCTKTSFTNNINSLKSSNDKLYKLLLAAQYGVAKACGTTSNSGRGHASSLYSAANGSINKIPSKACTN